jgi:hypothetical protein
MAGLKGWLLYRTQYGVAVPEARKMYVAASRQAALNLTTISHTEAEADVAWTLASATGAGDRHQASFLIAQAANELCPRVIRAAARPAASHRTALLQSARKVVYSMTSHLLRTGVVIVSTTGRW